MQHPKYFLPLPKHCFPSGFNFFRLKNNLYEKILYLLVFGLLGMFKPDLGATTCNATITLSSQDDVDNFPINHGCDTITGNLTIDGSGIGMITNLDSLIGLKHVAGFLLIFDTDIPHVDGLSNLVSVGQYIFINGNPSLANFDGLSNLVSVGDFLALNANGVIQINGFPSLVSVGGGLEFFSNYNLTQINGFPNLVSVGERLLISENPDLVSVNGLSNLDSVGTNLFIIENATLTDLNGLSNLRSLGGQLFIQFNAALAECCGLLPLLVCNDGVTGSISMSNNSGNCNNNGADITEANCGPCVILPIPTLSQWALFLFALIVYTVALVGVYNVKRLKKELV